MRVTVKIRHAHEGASATLHPEENGRVRVRLEGPQRAITPGQAAVFYDGDVIVGGGWIMKECGLSAAASAKADAAAHRRLPPAPRHSG
jgi:tRNA U34 2-thiouridine synthase MnmA/TrmU